MRTQHYISAAMIMTALCGCRLLETGYGDDNAVIRTSADAVSAAGGAARSTLTWAGAKVMSYGDDLAPDAQLRLISLGEHAAAAYRVHPDLPDGYTPLSQEEFSKLDLTSGRYRYEAETGFAEDTESVGFGARLSRLAHGDEMVVAFRGSNAPGEDEHWMQDWLYDAQQGGGGTPKQYVYGLELLSAVRNAFPDAALVVTGHSLGGGIAAYSTMNLAEPRRLICATYNAAGISSITLLSIPRDTVERATRRISNIRSKGDPVSAIPGTQLVGEIYEVDNLRFANHSIDGLLIDMRAGRKDAGQDGCVTSWTIDRGAAPVTPAF